MANTMFITPVQRESAQGRHKQTYHYYDSTKDQVLPAGKALGKTRANGAGVKIEFVPDYDNQRLKTFLDEVVDNPYFKSNQAHVPESIKASTRITKQNLFELNDGVILGTYTDKLSGGGLFNQRPSTDITKINTTFIESFYVTLYDRVNIFTDESPRQRLAMHMLKNHPRVALSKEVINSNMHWFYVSEENEALVEQDRKQDLIDNAIAAKVMLLNQSSEFRAYQVACLSLYKDQRAAVKGKANPDEVKRQLNTFIGPGKNQMENIQLFMGLIEQLKDVKTRERFDIKFLIQQAFNTSVLSTKDGFIYWDSKAGIKERYKWTTLLKLENFILDESLTYNPEDGKDSAYGDMRDEVIKRGGRIE